MLAWVDDEILGDDLRRFRCAGCGYGASRETPPERCPMCASMSWLDVDAPRRAGSPRASRSTLNSP